VHLNIGILGGTFDPPHIGHLIVAEYAREELFLDKILFVPAATPPHKVHKDVGSSIHRLAMTQLAMQGNPHFDVSEIETQRGGVSFTVETLERVRASASGDELFLLIGMDNLIDFHTWKSPDRILELASVVVMTRPGFSANDIPPLMKNKVRLCQVPEIAVASRTIRQRVAAGKSIHYMVTDPVHQYIELHGLYRGNENAKAL
jgi:nicotinate-nucleotide adenylyltransferase